MREISRELSTPVPPSPPSVVEGARKIHRNNGRTRRKTRDKAPVKVAAAYQPRTRVLRQILVDVQFRHDDEIFKRAYSTGLRDLCFLPGTEKELGVENGFLFLLPWSAIAVRGIRARNKKISPLVIGELKDFELDALHLLLAALAYDEDDLRPICDSIRKSNHAYIAEWMASLNEQSANAPNRVRPDDFLQFDTPNAPDDLRNLPGFFTVNIVETIKRLAAA